MSVAKRLFLYGFDMWLFIMSSWLGVVVKLVTYMRLLLGYIVVDMR